MNQTQQVLDEMLKEHTGHVLTDSGGEPQYDEDGKLVGYEHGFGRHCEINVGKDFEQQQPSRLVFEVRNGKFEYIDITHNIYHWLAERLDYDEDANKALDELSEMNPRDSWHAIAQDFPEWYVDQLNQNGKVKYRAAGIYGDGGPLTFNTYNYENLLSQDIECRYFELEPTDGSRPFRTTKYLVVQIHGGCDARWGYTKPRVFQVDENIGELSFLDYNRASLYCTGEGHHPSAPKPVVDEDKMPEWYDHRWFNDGGYHVSDPSGWSSDDHDKVDDLENYEIKILTEEDSEWEQGKLCITEDGVGYCPECGARLGASSY